jgi:hypothetical protein
MSFLGLLLRNLKASIRSLFQLRQKQSNKTSNSENQLADERPKLIALYLPQFHPIPENDAWWGKGFTEWTNVARATPLFDEHYQPRIPADLGFYDLRVPETRQAQANLAQQHGIGAFCYYHYWFAGKRLLERPFNEVLASGTPNFPFCLCWANQSWTGIWHGAPDRILIEQTYPGVVDATQHFQALLPAFHDKRYLRVAGKPVFVIFRPRELPESRGFINLWKKLALENGLPGFHFVGFASSRDWNYLADGFDAALWTWDPKLYRRTKISAAHPTVLQYGDVAQNWIPKEPAPDSLYPCLMPNWDNTPRCGAEGYVYHQSTPELFRAQVRAAFEWARKRPSGQKIIFVKAWNEWAEGNYLEPDMRHGLNYLQVIKEELRGRG